MSGRGKTMWQVELDHMVSRDRAQNGKPPPGVEAGEKRRLAERLAAGKQRDASSPPGAGSGQAPNVTDGEIAEISERVYGRSH